MGVRSTMATGTGTKRFRARPSSGVGCTTTGPPERPVRLRRSEWGYRPYRDTRGRTCPRDLGQRGRKMKILGKLGAAATIYSLLRSPAGQRVLDEVKRQAMDPENRRRAAEFVGRLRPGGASPEVGVDRSPRSGDSRPGMR